MFPSNMDKHSLAKSSIFSKYGFENDSKNNGKRDFTT